MSTRTSWMQKERRRRERERRKKGKCFAIINLNKLLLNSLNLAISLKLKPKLIKNNLAKLKPKGGGKGKEDRRKDALPSSINLNQTLIN